MNVAKAVFKGATTVLFLGVISLLLVVLVLILTGCSHDDDATETFVTVEEGTYYYIMFDRDTKVMYYMAGSRRYFTPLINADGTPKLWEGEE